MLSLVETMVQMMVNPQPLIKSRVVLIVAGKFMLPEVTLPPINIPQIQVSLLSGMVGGEASRVLNLLIDLAAAVFLDFLPVSILDVSALVFPSALVGSLIAPPIPPPTNFLATIEQLPILSTALDSPTLVMIILLQQGAALFAAAGPSFDLAPASTLANITM